MTVDLRSDTLTQPSTPMREAMMGAPLGDDVYGEDPTVNALQEKMARMFGMAAALFCPSGTMCNQLAIRLHTQPQDEVICDQRSHIYLYEGGGIAANSLCSVQLLDGDRGRITASQIEAAIQPDDEHFPHSQLVSIENTVNKTGGSCYPLEQMQQIHFLCSDRGLKLHLDGARLFNAMLATDQSPTDLGPLFDSITICLSKGLGAPVGSILLLRNGDDLDKAIRIRKMMGGGMRQSGMLAAAGIYALDHHLERLEEDHRRARDLAAALGELSWVEEIMPVDTNIVVFAPDPEFMEYLALKEKLAAAGLLCSAFGPNYLRFVTHLDVDDEGVEQAIDLLRGV